MGYVICIRCLSNGARNLYQMSNWWGMLFVFRCITDGVCNSYLVAWWRKGWAMAHCPHDDVIKWKNFPRCWPFVLGIHRSPVNSPHKGQWRGALIFSLICTRISGWVHNGEAGDFRRHRAHYDVTVIISEHILTRSLDSILLMKIGRVKLNLCV